MITTLLILRARAHVAHRHEHDYLWVTEEEEEEFRQVLADRNLLPQADHKGRLLCYGLGMEVL